MCLTCLCYRQPKSQVGRSQLVMFFLGPCIIGMAALEMMQTFFKYLSINTLEDLVPSHLSVPKKTLAFSQRTRNHWNSPGCQPTKPGTLTPRCRHPAPRRQISSMELHASPWRSSGSQKWCASSSAKCKKQAILHWLWAHQKEGFGVDFVLGVLGERWSRWGVTRLWRAVLLCLSRVKIFISPRRQQAGIETPLSLCINWHGLILQVSSIQNLVWILIDSLTYRLHVSSYRVIKRLDAVSE